MGKKVLKAVYGSPDKPLIIGNKKIQCYVLEDETRVLSMRGVIGSLGITSTGAQRLVQFAQSKSINPFIDADLLMRINNPILFLPPHGGKLAYGYEATILADICEAVIKARNEGFLQQQQKHIAHQCDILMAGFARIGIIGLVDEITGYQEIRNRRTLEKILEKFIAKEVMKWQKRFPDEFYSEIFRLKNWQWMGRGVNPPILVGKITKDIVYQRLAPGIIEELEKRNPPDDEGHRKHKHQQWLTEDIGHPALQRHLGGLIMLMRATASGNWNKFYHTLNRAAPKFNETLWLDMETDED